MLGKELFRIGLFVVEKIGVKIRKTRLKYGKQRSRSTQMGGKGLATLPSLQKKQEKQFTKPTHVAVYLFRDLDRDKSRL